MAKYGCKDIPDTLEEDILKYLHSYNPADEAAEHAFIPGVSAFGLEDANNLLEAIIRAIVRRARLKDVYECKQRAHNQFPLFDLSKVIPDFYIDDEIQEHLTFRETLVISTFDGASNTLVPLVVGGLCLDIQTATGQHPFQRITTGLEQKIVEALTAKMQAERDKLQKEPDSNPNSAVPEVSEEAPQQANAGESDVMNENMIGVSPSDEEIVEYARKIQAELLRPKSKFLIHLSSQFDVNGNNAGSRITAWVDRNLHTLEEKRKEYIITDNLKNEKSLYCGLQHGSYYIQHKSSVDDILDKRFYSLMKARDYIGEGSTFVLMRYLAVTRYIGTFELSTMYINGDMCRNIYICHGPESGIVNDSKLDVCKIYRTIIEECGIVHQCVTVLTLQGQIVKQEWQGCDFVLHVNPLAEIKNEKPVGGEHLLLKKSWEKDMQLYSQFLDRKVGCTLKTKSYLLDHPELKDIIADYVKTILQLKPEEILDFTINHFLHYSPEKLPYNNYFEEDDNYFSF